jgi:monoamine oxidase
VVWASQGHRGRNGGEKRAEAELAACIERHKGDCDRLSTLVEACHSLRVSATFAGPMDFGADDDEISVTDYRAAADLDPNYFTREGFGALIHRWGADVPVTLSTPVRRIRWDGPGVEVETDRGTIRAQAAIVTVSTGVLAFEEIAFHPRSADGPSGSDLRPADGASDEDSGEDRRHAAGAEALRRCPDRTPRAA